jgi:hypothetical protein
VTEAKIGTFEDLMKLTVPPMQPIARRLREIIVDIDPDLVEVVRLGDRAATFGIGPRKMSEGYAYILPHGKWVNLGFYQGATLPDPTGIMEGTGARMRHVKVRSVEDAGRAAIRSLLKQALSERKRALGR